MVINKIIELKDNWDMVPTLQNDSNNGPIVENRGVETLREFIKRKNVGSFLLSGQRGSGKTTSITHLLKEIDKDTCLMIFLDAIYLEATENDHQKEDKLLQILRQLIRSLIKELESRGYTIPNELNELKYDLKATEIERLQKTSLTIGQKSSLGANGKFFGDIIDSNISVYEEGKNNTSKLNKTIGFTIEGLADNFSKVISDLENGKLRKKGKFEIEFKTSKKLPNFIKLPKFKEKKSINKIIFIIDELDAYDTKPEDILDVIKKFKNLFTLSKAQFIFIVGEDTYKTVLTNDTFRTLFTEKYFLPKPKGDDLSNFLDKIVFNPKEISQNIEWEQLKWYVISLSNHNFYQLMQEIRSYTDYDIKSNKARINIGKLSFQESIQASVHYALNEIYKYHLNDRAYCHFDNILFDELGLIEKNLLDWLFNKNPQSPISLKITSGNTYSYQNIGIESKIRNAKLSFLRYLYLLADVPIPPNFGDSDSITINWETLLVGLSNFETVMKGLTGPITPIEIELVNNIETIKDKLSKILKLYKVDFKKDDIFTLLEKFNKKTNFLYPEDYVSSIKNSFEKINSNLLYERKPEDTKNALDLIKNLSSLLDVYIYNPNNPYIYKVDWGDIKENLTKEIFLGEDSSHGNKLLSRMTLFPSIPKSNKQLEVVYKTKIKADSIINFLINTKNNSSELEDEFYMVRVDTRKGANTYSILLKPEGDPNWNFITKPFSAFVTKFNPDKWIDIKIILYKNKVNLFIKNKNKFFKSLECDLSKPVLNFGFGNELGEVVIKDLKFK